MTDQVVVITGASSGIGRATALRFARKGARLVLVSRSAAALDELVAECERLGTQALAMPADVSDEAAVRAVAEAATQRFGRIDVWVNDAAVGTFGTLLDTEMEDFRRVIDVNVMGYVYGSRVALEVMTRQGEGVLVNVASIVGEVAQPYSAAYSMSKAAVRALGASLRSELRLAGMSGVRVATILPPTIDTPFFEHAGNTSGRKLLAMPPVYPPEKVARAIVRAAAAPKPEVVVGGLGKAFVRLHQLRPRLIEGQMAAQVEKMQLSPKESAPNTPGILYAVPAGGRVTGGWRGAERTRNRKLLGVALLATGAGVLVTRLVRPAS